MAEKGKKVAGLNSQHSAQNYLKIVDNKYQVLKETLGSGSFATTYLTIDLSTGEKLACKMISKMSLIEKINESKNKSLTKEYFVGALKN